MNTITPQIFHASYCNFTGMFPLSKSQGSYTLSFVELFQTFKLAQGQAELAQCQMMAGDSTV